MNKTQPTVADYAKALGLVFEHCADLETTGHLPGRFLTDAPETARHYGMTHLVFRVNLPAAEGWFSKLRRGHILSRTIKKVAASNAEFEYQQSRLEEVNKGAKLMVVSVADLYVNPVPCKFITHE